MSRLTLQWFNLTKQEGQDLCLKIPICDVYSGIIDRAFPAINHIGWRESTHGTCYTYITHIAPHFQRELDEAYALDFNFLPNVFPLAYTDAGTFERIAKENQNPQAIAELVRRLAEVIQRHPTLARSDILSAMPPRPSKTFHLPVELVNGIAATLGRPVGLKLIKAEHPKLRALPIEQKLTTLAGAFTLAEPVTGKSVLVVDDLYQSGVTTWSLAKFLRSQGARHVYALACVKSWSDTDN